MDPQAALNALRTALANGDLDTARELFEALDTWLTNGGFFPAEWGGRG